MNPWCQWRVVASGLLVDAINHVFVSRVGVYAVSGPSKEDLHVPTIRFYGKQYEGFRALGVALAIGLPVMNLRRYWDISGGEPCGPYWEMEFRTVPDLGQPEWWKHGILAPSPAVTPSAGGKS